MDMWDYAVFCGRVHRGRGVGIRPFLHFVFVSCFEIWENFDSGKRAGDIVSGETVHTFGTY